MSDIQEEIRWGELPKVKNLASQKMRSATLYLERP